MTRPTKEQTLELLDRIKAVLQDPRPPWLILRMEELKKGNWIVQPGHAPWLPLDDWHATDCVSISGGTEVRIIAISAREPRTGAFGRLVDGILASGLTPVVVAPFPGIQAILERWGWERTDVGDSFETREDQWRPPEGWRRKHDPV